VSQTRRNINWDYYGKGIYLLTLTTVNRAPILGQLVETNGSPHIVPSAVGEGVEKEINNLPNHYPQIEVMRVQLMPDHVHCVIYVHDKLPVHLSRVITGLKCGCNKIYVAHKSANTEPAITNKMDSSTGHVSALSCAENSTPTPTGHVSALSCAEELSLFSEGYHDRILFHAHQLHNMLTYVSDNPRRLALKRANPQLFTLRRNIQHTGFTFSALGNLFLLGHPNKSCIQCSRSLSEQEIAAKKEQYLAQAEQGYVHISAAISAGEKAICQALRQAGYPLVILLSNGFPEEDDEQAQYFKPNGIYFESCAKGQLLLLEPSPEAFEDATVKQMIEPKVHDLPHTTTRYHFMALNAVAALLSNKP